MIYLAFFLQILWLLQGISSLGIQIGYSWRRSQTIIGGLNVDRPPPRFVHMKSSSDSIPHVSYISEPLTTSSSNSIRNGTTYNAFEGLNDIIALKKDDKVYFRKYIQAKQITAEQGDSNSAVDKWRWLQEKKTALQSLRKSIVEKTVSVDIIL